MFKNEKHNSRSVYYIVLTLATKITKILDKVFLYLNILNNPMN